MGLITIKLMNAPTNHVPGNPQNVHTIISDDEQPQLLVIYAGCPEEMLYVFIHLFVVKWDFQTYILVVVMVFGIGGNGMK